KNATPAQISMAWMLCKKPWIVPIPGTRKIMRMKENMGASEIKLSNEEIKCLDSALDSISLSRSAVSSSRETIVTWLNNLGYRKETDNPRILIAYLSYPFPDGVDANASASRVIVNGELYGSVEYMAKVIQKNTNADMFEIQPLESYGDDFNSVADRALEEQENDILPELSAHIENLDEYDTIFVGYPIWWYDMPQDVLYEARKIVLLPQLTIELSACSKAESCRQKNLQYDSIPAFFFLSLYLYLCA
ncbi:MAG: flavodoxin, partial [Porcipelethomonas sp.]